MGITEEDSKKLGELSAKTYKAQAIWFLNANWTKTFESDEEQVRSTWCSRRDRFCNQALTKTHSTPLNLQREMMWKYVDLMAKLDKKKGEVSCDVVVRPSAHSSCSHTSTRSPCPGWKRAGRV